MGLDCSHNAFSGGYVTFNRLRQAVADAAGGSYPPHADRSLDNDSFYLDTSAWPGLTIFLAHADCEGVLTPNECVQVANDLEKVLPNVSEKYATVHMPRGVKAAVERFVDGCRTAARLNENLEFQ